MRTIPAGCATCPGAGLTPLAWLLGFVLPACGATGAAGLPTPLPMDMTKLERPSTPNTFLAGSAGMQPTPDKVTEHHAKPAATLYSNARTLFAAQPRTYIAAEYPDRLQIHYVVRSALLNYPDLVTVQVNPAGNDRSTIVIWSRSVYGRSDFGVNRTRTEAWLAALQHAKER
jgi:uncharacterized protein (DUF1499 family)